MAAWIFFAGLLPQAGLASKRVRGPVPARGSDACRVGYAKPHRRRVRPGSLPQQQYRSKMPDPGPSECSCISQAVGAPGSSSRDLRPRQRIF